MRPGAVLAVIGGGVAAVLALWWTGTRPVSGLGDELTGADRVCGLLAGYGVVVLVALMARLPPLERGADRTGWRGGGGGWAGPRWWCRAADR